MPCVDGKDDLIDADGEGSMLEACMKDNIYDEDVKDGMRCVDETDCMLDAYGKGGAQDADKKACLI